MSNIALTDRVLYSDGDSVVAADKILSLVSSGSSTDNLFVDIVTTEIQQFNGLVKKEEQITQKLDTRPNNMDWNIPQEYADIDPASYAVQTFFDIIEAPDYSKSLVETRTRKKRLITELALFEKLELMPVLRVLIYIINTLQEKDIVWGVGRGSSVSSYLLYVLGVHDVDSVEYDLDIRDFLRLFLR